MVALFQTWLPLNSAKSPFQLRHLYISHSPTSTILPLPEPNILTFAAYLYQQNVFFPQWHCSCKVNWLLQLGALWLLKKEHLGIQHWCYCNKQKKAINSRAVEAGWRAKSKSPLSRRITLILGAPTKVKKKKKLKTHEVDTQTNSYFLVWGRWTTFGWWIKGWKTGNVMWKEDDGVNFKIKTGNAKYNLNSKLASHPVTPNCLFHSISWLNSGNND